MAQTAVYVRVSTNDQRTDSQHVDLQRCLAANCELATVYEDTFTGKSMQRPGFGRLLAACQRGEIGKVVVWRLDRLGRTARGLLELLDTLIEQGVTLISVRDGFDLSTAAGKLVYGVLASVAQFELEVRTERQRAGIQAARAANGGRCPWGGRKPGSRSKRIVERDLAIRELLAVGRSKSEIARVLGCCRQAVYEAQSRIAKA